MYPIPKGGKTWEQYFVFIIDGQAVIFNIYGQQERCPVCHKYVILGWINVIRYCDDLFNVLAAFSEIVSVKQKSRTQCCETKLYYVGYVLMPADRTCEIFTSLWQKVFSCGSISDNISGVNFIHPASADLSFGLMTSTRIHRWTVGKLQWRIL